MLISFPDVLKELRQKLPRGDLKIGVLTSCTGEKSVAPCLTPLSIEDLKDCFRYADRSAELWAHRKPAEELYIGQQHARLMRAVRPFRTNHCGEIDLRILSAGFGIVRGDQKLLPYNVTFNGMKSQELREWSDFLRVPDSAVDFLRDKHDLKIIMLGEKYLDACQFDWAEPLNGLTVVLCSKERARRIPPVPHIYRVGLSNAEAELFRCGLIGLKGELASMLLWDTVAMRKAS